MPRLLPLELRSAFRKGPTLFRLTKVTRLLETAESELRWIRDKYRDRKAYNTAIQQRLNYRPLQYVLGDQPFLNLAIKCSESALVPRWETEEWTGELVNVLKDFKGKIVDACTGTGCIALSMAQLSNAEVTAIDISDACLQLAKENEVINGLQGRVHWTKADILRNAPQCAGMSLLVSNPPYVTEREYSLLDRSVREYEPKLALLGDLEFYGALVKIVRDNIETCEGFVFEVGNQNQVDRVRELMSDVKWVVKGKKDSAGNIRCVVGWKQEGRLKVLKGLT